MSLGFAAFLVVILGFPALAVASEVRARSRERDEGLNHLHPRQPEFNPEVEARVEAKAAELLESVVGHENTAMYRELGFLRVRGGQSEGYAYLVYPHRPLVAYDEGSGELLNEYCVGFPDQSEPETGTRLPDSDDVLAKWMALTGDERGLIADSNMHLPGRQVDPEQVRRDLQRLSHWEANRRPGTGRMGVANNLPA